jgi:hypothetical protein
MSYILYSVDSYYVEYQGEQEKVRDIESSEILSFIKKFKIII